MKGKGGEEGTPVTVVDSWSKARTFPVKEFTAVFPRKRDAARDLAHQLHDLRDVVIVLAVPRPRGRIEEVVPARDELEYLRQGKGWLAWVA